MNKIIDETWLTRLVDTYGNIALTSVVSTVYNSSLFKFFFTTFVTLTLFSLGLGIHRRTVSSKTIFAAFAFLLIYPVPYKLNGSKPAAYVVIDSLGCATRSVFERSILGIISSSEVRSSRNTMPPGIVLDMIIQAATTKLNLETREKIHAFVVNCLPNALCKSGEHATFDDIFSYTVDRKVNEFGQYYYTYANEKLNLIALANDTSYNSFQVNNCKDGYDIMRHALELSRLGSNDEKDMLVNRVVKHKTSAPETTENWQNWKKSVRGKAFQNLTQNLSKARAVSYEKSEIIQNIGTKGGSSWFQHTGTDASVRELMASNGALASLGYHLSDLKDLIPNVFGSRWSFSLGASIKDLKERIEMMPYYLAAVRLLLKITLPFFVLTLFFQTFRFLFLWAGAWITTLLIPGIISASRAIGNSILLSKLGIQEIGKSGNKSLAHGIDLSVATEFLDEFVPLAYALINQEIKIISILSGCILVGGWLGGGGANGFVSWLSNSIQGNLTSRAASASVGKVATAAKGVSEKAIIPTLSIASNFTGGLAYGAYRAVSSLRNTSSSNNEDEGKESTNWKLPKRN